MIKTFLSALGSFVPPQETIAVGPVFSNNPTCSKRHPPDNFLKFLEMRLSLQESAR